MRPVIKASLSSNQPLLKHILSDKTAMPSVLFVYTSADKTLTGAPTVSALSSQDSSKGDLIIGILGVVPARGCPPVLRTRPSRKHRLCCTSRPQPSP
jgi:hypothetical protein